MPLQARRMLFSSSLTRSFLASTSLPGFSPLILPFPVVHAIRPQVKTLLVAARLLFSPQPPPF
jgi:hypothetical protein